MPKRSFICCLMVLILCSCESAKIDSPLKDDCRVWIAASLSKRDIVTRAPYVPVTDADKDADAPTFEHPLKAEVWASSSNWLFPDEDEAGEDTENYKVAYHTTANFQSGGPQLLAEVIYSKLNTPPIYFVAMAPDSGWATTDGSSASIRFSGHEDVMFAPHAEGSYGKKDSEGNDLWPTLYFRHLLTWLKIEIKAESEEIADIWGKITDMRIISSNTVTIDITRPYDPATSLSYSGSESMKFYAADSESNETYPASGGEYIPYSGYAEAAYVLCGPVDATAYDTETGLRTSEYAIQLTTENRSVTVNVDLKTGADQWCNENTMGKQFTLRLTFRKGDNITVSAMVEDWKNGGISSGHFYE